MNELHCTRCKKAMTMLENLYCDRCYTNWRTAQRRMFIKKVFQTYKKCAAEGCEVSDRDMLTIHHLDELGDRFDIENVRLLCYNHHTKLNRGRLQLNLNNGKAAEVK